jgi:hypothetical protein
MNKILKNSLLGTAVLVLFFLIAVQPVMAEDVPPLPMIVSGVALIDGVPAPVDTVIAAHLDGEEVEKFLVNTSSGDFTLHIAGSAEDEGKTVTFTIDGKDTGKSFSWESGKIISAVELSIGDASDSGSSKHSSSSGSGSLKVSDDSEDGGEVIENSTVTQPEVKVTEKTEPESTGGEAEVEKGEESSEEASKTSSAPGFQAIYAISGIILLTFGLEFWRESRRKP